MAEEGMKINKKMGLIAFVIIIVMFLVNAIVNPLEVPDTDRAPLGKDSEGNEIYPTKVNERYICGPMLIIGILFLMILVGNSVLGRKAHIMSIREAWRYIPVDDQMSFRLPSLDELDVSGIVPKDSGKSVIVRYVHTEGFAYIKLNLMSDFKTSASDYARKSPIMGFTTMPVAWSTAQSMLRGDSNDLIKKLSQLDEQAEKVLGKPLTAELFKESYDKEKQRMVSEG